MNQGRKIKIKHPRGTNISTNMGPTAEGATERDEDEGAIHHNISKSDIEDIQRMIQQANDTTEIKLAGMKQQIQLSEVRTKTGIREIVKEELANDIDKIEKMIQKATNATEMSLANDIDKIEKMIQKATNATEMSLVAMQKQITESNAETRKSIEELAAAQSWTLQKWRKWTTDGFHILLYAYGILFLGTGIMDIIWSYFGGKSLWSWGSKTIHAEIGTIIKAFLSRSS